MDEMSQIVSEIDIESRRLRIINAVVASVDQPPGSQVGPRLQRHVQMLLIHSGSMKVVIDERPPYEVHAGHMCILLPGHREEISFPHKMTRQTLLRGDFLGLTAGMAEWLESVPPVRKLSSALTYLAREALTSEQTRLTAQGAWWTPFPRRCYGGSSRSLKILLLPCRSQSKRRACSSINSSAKS